MRSLTLVLVLALATTSCLARRHSGHRQLRGDDASSSEGWLERHFKVFHDEEAEGHGPHKGPHGPPHGRNDSDNYHDHHGPHHGPHGPPLSPEYEVLNKTFDYTTRLYNASSWVATNASGWAWEFALPKAVQKLMGYAHGGNQKDKHFPPGVPIISKYLHSKDYSNCEQDFLVAAYLPKRPGCNATLPTPIDPSVVVKSFPAAKVYVRSFPGFAFHWTFLAEAFKMAKALRQDEIEVRDGMFFAAVYDPPTRLFGRHNEVWYLPSKTKSAAADFLWASEGMASISGAEIEQLSEAQSAAQSMTA